MRGVIHDHIQRSVEILVDGATHHVIRKRETYADLVAHELT